MSVLGCDQKSPANDQKILLDLKIAAGKQQIFDIENLNFEVFQQIIPNFEIWFELDFHIETGSDNVIARRRGWLGEFKHSRDHLSCSQYPARESLWTCFRTWV